MKSFYKSMEVDFGCNGSPLPIHVAPAQILPRVKVRMNEIMLLDVWSLTARGICRTSMKSNTFNLTCSSVAVDSRYISVTQLLHTMYFMVQATKPVILCRDMLTLTT